MTASSDSKAPAAVVFVAFAFVALAAGAVAGCSTTSATGAGGGSGPAPAKPRATVNSKNAGGLIVAAVGRPAPGQLPDSVAPTRYAVDLSVDPRLPTFRGEVRIQLAVRRPTQRIHLHARDLRIEHAELLVGAKAHAARVVLARGPGAEPSWGERALFIDKVVPRGKAELRLRFRGRYDKRLAGLYRARHGKRWYAYTQFEAADARKAFPCFDEPRFKVPFALTLRVPRSMRAFANTPRASSAVRGDTRVTTFLPTKPLPTYLVAFVVGDFDVVAGGSARGAKGSVLPLRAIVPKGKGGLAKTSLGITRAVLPVLERYFGRPYPYRKLDLAALVAFGSGAMENAGLITFRESRLLFAERAASALQLRHTAGVIAHELAHQWFGNLVTMRWWDDLWLNEAFATWMGIKAVDLYQPQLRAREALLGWRSAVFEVDALSAARAIVQPIRSVAQAEAAFDGLTYVKGASVLSMVEAWVGEARFRAGIRRYLARHAFKNATSRDLFAALRQASGKPVGAVMRTFIERAGVPLVSAALRCESGKPPHVELRQQRYRPLGAPPATSRAASKPWRVPVCVLYDRGRKARPGRACGLLDGVRGSIALSGVRGCPRWIHPNANDTGYYHWALPSKQLAALTRASRRLPATTRAAIIEKSWLAVAAGQSRPRDLYAVMGRFRGTLERAVVKQLVATLRRVRSAFEPARPSKAFRRAVRWLLGPSWRKLGWRPAPGEPPQRRMLRAELLVALGRHGGDRGVVARAARLARRFVADPTSVAADIAPAALRVAVASGKLAVAKLEPLLSSATPAVRVAAVRALAAVPPGKPAATALRWLREGKVGTQNVQIVLRRLLQRRELTDQLYGELRTRMAAYVGRMPTFGRRSAARLPEAVGALCEPKRREQALALFAAAKIRGSARARAIGAERSARCIKLRAWGGASARRYPPSR